MFGVILVLLNFLGGYKCQFTIHDDIPFTPLLKLQEMVDANLDFMIGEDIRVDYSGIYSQFEYSVFEREQPTSGSLREDYRANPNSFESSKICEFQESEAIFKTLSSYTLADQEILSMAVHLNLSQLYLVNSKFELYSLAYEISALGTHFIGFHTKLAAIPTTSSQGISLYVDSSITNCLFVSTQDGLFMFNPRDHFPSLVKVLDAETALQEPVYSKWNGKLLARYSKGMLSVYSLNDWLFVHEGRVQLTQLQTITNHMGKKLECVDVDVQPGEIWLLDREFGFYCWTYENGSYVESKSYRVPYGNKLFFRKNAEFLFIVAFELRRQTFLVELHLQQPEMHLTRFYNQITSVQNVLFSNELMLVVGQVELMAIQHSISQYLLRHFLFKDKWQRKYFYSVAEAVDVLQLSIENLSSPSNSYFITLFINKIEFFALERKAAALRCHPKRISDKGRHSVYVLINATDCDSSKINTRKYCTIDHTFNFEVHSAIPEHLSVASSLTLLALTCGVAAICICSIIGYRRRKRRELDELRGTLKRKLDQFSYPYNR